MKNSISPWWIHVNLTDYVKTVSIEDFGWEFKHQALWNKRLRTTGGRFFPKDGHLDFNPKLYEEHGLETFRKIVRHELCHYHLYFQGKGYKHADRDFKDLLAKVDGLRYAPKDTRSGGELLPLSMPILWSYHLPSQTPCQYTEIWLRFVSRQAHFF